MKTIRVTGTFVIEDEEYDPGPNGPLNEATFIDVMNDLADRPSFRPIRRVELSSVEAADRGAQLDRQRRNAVDRRLARLLGE